MTAADANDTRELVVLADPIAQDGIRLLERRLEVVELRAVPPTEWEDHLARAHAVIVRTFVLDAAAIERLGEARVIVKHGAGVDNIDVAAATAAGIPVLSTPGVGAAAVAEHAAMLTLMVARRAFALHEAVVGGRFDVRNQWRLTELEGKVVGIVGLGRIGRHMARISRHGFGARVIAYDPAIPADAEPQRDLVEMVDDLDDLLERADFVSLHAALTDGTRHLIGAPQLERMKPNAILVNTARGGLVDEAALTAALRAGGLRGAGLDVFEEEPPASNSELLTLPNVVCSPHIGGLTTEAATRLSEAAATAVLAVLDGDPAPNGLLNPAYADRRRTASGRPG